MTNKSSIQADVIKKIQECLKELGFEAETQLSEHEGLVHARQEMQGKCLKVVAHITDRDVQPANAGSSNVAAARARAAQIAIRPTLAAQTATRPYETKDPKAGCQ
jgi:hypothetical protein